MKKQTPHQQFVLGPDLNQYREQFNPLRGLTIARAVSLLEAAQRGQFADLQWTYHFIEQTEPILMTLLERRTSALDEMDWSVKIISERRRRGNFDETLAEEQAAALSELYDGIDNLKEAVTHLECGAFRMFAHLNKHRAADGRVRHLEPLDQWNFVRRGMYGEWYWNPSAREANWQALSAADRIEPADFVIRAVPRHINRPALIKYIRKALGEKDWSGFIEIFGIPRPVVTMPQSIPAGKETEYEAAALSIASGTPGAVPNGTTVSWPGEVRGNQPFQAYLEWCDQQLVLIGTGGLLTVLSMPQGIGSGASGEHGDAFRSIARASAYRISEVFQKQLDAEFLAQAFPNRPALAYFELSATQETRPGEILDDCVKAKAAGLQVDATEISERTGYTLTLAPDAPAPSGQWAAGSGQRPFVNRQSSIVSSSSADVDAKLRATAAAALSEAERLDMAPLALRLRSVLELGDPELIRAALENLRKDLPDLARNILAAPAAAGVLADTTAAALVNGYAEAAAAHAFPGSAGLPPALRNRSLPSDLLLNGDSPGHPFRGNQHEEGEFDNPTDDEPPRIKASEADDELTKEFDELDPAGRTVKFGKRLKNYLDKKPDGDRRKEHLPWARDTVRTRAAVELDDRDVYLKSYRGKDGKPKGFVTVVSKSGEALEAFNMYRKPARKLIEDAVKRKVRP